VALGSSHVLYQPLLQPRELTKLRTASSDTSLLPDGSRQTTIYTAPINYQNAAGSLVPIDDTLVASSKQGYAYENKADSYKLYLPGNLATAPVRIEAGDSWLSFSLNGASGSPTVSGTQAVYTNALPGVDLVYDATREGVKESVILHSATAGTALSFSTTVSSSITASANPVGGINLKDPSGKVLASLDAPYMFDAANNELISRAVGLSWTKTAGSITVTVTPDPKWLSDPARVFPVTIDPTVTLKPAAADCWIADGPDQNGTACGSGSDHLRVGYNGTNLRRSLVKFDLSSVPSNATVTDGDLALYLDATRTTTGNAADYSVKKVITHDWSGSAPTWNKYDGVHNWTTAGGDFPTTTYDTMNLTGATSGYKHFHPTSLVQSWVSGSASNYGALF
jgi:hypothetical protein